MRIIKEAKEDWLYMQLHMFKQGLLAAVHIKDDLIFELRDNGILVLRFDDNSDYFKLFGFDEYTIRRLSYMFSSYGGSSEYFDSYTANEDWNQGYLYNYFNNENKELFEEIKQYLSPELDLDDNNSCFSNDGIISCLSNSYLTGNNIIARITISSAPNSINLTTASDCVFKTREYYGPVTIDTLNIRLLNRHGDVIPLNGNDFSFLIEFTILEI